MRYKRLTVAMLIVLLLTLGGAIILASWPLIDQVRMGNLRWEAVRGDQVVAEEVVEHGFGVVGTARLVVENHRGSVTVRDGGDNEVKITAQKRGRAATQEQAEKELAALKVIATQTDDTIKVLVEGPPEDSASDDRSLNFSEVDFTIIVPEQTMVAVSTSVGDVSLSGTEGEANLRTRFGEIEVLDVAGGLAAESGSGDIILQEVYAEGADVSLNTRFGRVEYRGGSAGFLGVEGGSGAITLTDVAAQGRVLVASRFGQITLTRVAAPEYDLSTQSGAVQVENVAGRLNVRSGFGDVVVSKAQNVDLDLETKSGSVDFSGGMGSGPHSIITGYGSIRVAVPSEAGLDFDITTSFGEFRPELPVTLSGASGRSHWIGSINGGGPNLVVSARSGNIELRALDGEGGGQ